ncbi:MAG TPA: hypothetical protein VM324_09915 [Egibacteraceae bacterium]|nr:hypothetical protein [Egibacteraceae bacterium]
MRRCLTLLLALLVAVAAAPAGAAEAAQAAPLPAAGDGCAHTAAGTPRRPGAPARVLASAPAAGVAGTGSCAGVRPGARIVVDGSSVCTLNFRFTGRDRLGRTHTYMGTAGHCAFGGQVRPPVQRVWGPGQGPVVADAAGRRIGTFAYAIVNGARDFGLVRLDGDVASSPRMCHFGGPTGINSDRPSATTTLRYYGQGLLFGGVLPARTAVAQGMPDEAHVRATGLVVPGDSGAGVISADARAVGLVITLGAHGGRVGASGLDAGTMGIARLGPVLNRASVALREQLTLHTAARR